MLLFYDHLNMCVCVFIYLFINLLSRQLRKTERDRSRLKYMTGEWFYETKNHRHRDRIHGSDIIRASMRQKKPVTICECCQRTESDREQALFMSLITSIACTPSLISTWIQCLHHHFFYFFCYIDHIFTLKWKVTHKSKHYQSYWS